jgi:outer membrane protein insertion porin family
VDPDFTVDGVSRAVDLFYRTTRPINTLGEEYQYITKGGAIRFGVPFSELDTVFFGIGYEQTDITTSRGLPEAYFRFTNLYGQHSNSVPLTIGWQRDSRDSVITPMKGRYTRLNVEASAIGDVQYARLNGQYQEYFEITNKITLGINSEFGYGAGLGGKEYPLFKNFYAGGLGSVRVFEAGSLGPTDITGSYSGGNVRFNANAELYLPVPGSGNDKSFRIFGFMDAGNVWDTHSTNDKVSFESIRVSAGIGLSWISPMGPLRLSYGKPIRKQRTDRIEKFQFQIGTAF